MTPDERRALANLLSCLLDGELDRVQQEELGRLLAAHADAREEYLAHLGLHAELTRRSPVSTGLEFRPIAISRDTRTSTRATARRWWTQRRRLIAGLGGLAALLVVGFTWLSFVPGRLAQRESGAEPLDKSIALLARCVEAKWADTGMPTAPRSPLPPGRLRLMGGLARIEFYCGATMVVEGPAELELLSSTRVRCVQGKVRVHVPPQAEGFTIDAPDFHVIDRGTEVALEVGETHAAEVHVFQGLVEVRPQGDAAVRELVTGQGVRYRAGIESSRMPADPAKFVDSRTLAGRDDAEFHRQYETWVGASRRLRADPGLIAYYTFQNELAGPGPFLDLALTGSVGDGAIVGCRPAPGRWREKPALGWDQVSDRVRVTVPGRHESLTLSAWVWIDALDHRWNSLLMSDGYPKSAVHWQIGETGLVNFGVQGPGVMNGVNYLSPVILRHGEHFAEWVHLAAVHDATKRQFTHYLNGEPTARLPLKLDLPLHFGPAEIGNWNDAGHPDKRPIRNFHGRMDELLILSRPCSDLEIHDLYQFGRPRP